MENSSYHPPIITVQGWFLSHKTFLTTFYREIKVENIYPTGTLCYISFTSTIPHKVVNVSFTHTDNKQ